MTACNGTSCHNNVLKTYFLALNSILSGYNHEH